MGLPPAARTRCLHAPHMLRALRAGETLVRGGLLYLPDLDLYLAKALSGPRFQLAAEFALHLVQQVWKG